MAQQHSGPVPHYRGFTITLRHATPGRTHLDEWSARCRDLWQHTHHSQDADIHDPGGIQTHNTSKRAAADPRLRPRGRVIFIGIVTHLKMQIRIKNVSNLLGTGFPNLGESRRLPRGILEPWRWWQSEPRKRRKSPKDKAWYCKIPEPSATPVWQPWTSH